MDTEKNNGLHLCVCVYLGLCIIYIYIYIYWKLLSWENYN